jgi:hypothetical protein
MLGQQAWIGPIAQATGLTRQTSTASRMIRSAQRRRLPHGAFEVHSFRSDKATGTRRKGRTGTERICGAHPAVPETA